MRAERTRENSLDGESYNMNAHRLYRVWIPILLCCGAALPLIAGTHVTIPSKDTLPPLSLNVTEAQVTVSGAQSKANVLLVGYSRWLRNYELKLERNRAFLIADSAGAASLTPKGGVQPDSVWVAVDLQSGRYGSAAPASSPLREAAISADTLKKENNGQVKKLIAKLTMAYFVVVRPGEGAWELDAGDGSGHDRDLAIDGETEMSLDDLKAIGGAPAAPKNLEKGDLLFVFSPDQGTFSSIRLDQ